jgi:potassium-transporting ATPase KdpC subunit
MKKHITIACLYTLITAVVLGLVYPLVITGLAKVAFRDKADGQLIVRNGEIIGSRLLGQAFTGPGYFHSRPSAAGVGYDASASSGSNLAPTSKTLIDRINTDVSKATAGAPIPIDLVTASASGLDPDISPAAALYQVPRISRERRLPEAIIHQLVINQIRPRQFGLLGEPSVNVLLLNITLDEIK